MQDHFPQAKDYLSGLAVKAEGLIMTQWENLKAANLIPTSEDKRTIHPGGFPRGSSGTGG